MKENARIRQAILERLYKAREAHTGTLEEWVKESEPDVDTEKKDFALDVLQELSCIKRELYEEPYYRVTARGALMYEQGQDVC